MPDHEPQPAPTLPEKLIALNTLLRRCDWPIAAHGPCCVLETMSDE